MPPGLLLAGAWPVRGRQSGGPRPRAGSPGPGGGGVVAGVRGAVGGRGALARREHGGHLKGKG